jgi:hypothetical protein
MEKVIMIYRRNGHTSGGVAKFVVNLLLVQNDGSLHHEPIQGYKYNSREHGFVFKGNKEDLYKIIKQQYTIQQGIEL